ncbi:competence protein ComJ [Pseudomonas corrugata]|uniref:competence protein ComJ n=1 Tax=Pseudomonas corrugata TaxID=47879 RepID=UPI0009BE90B7|nr:competence protein ComJ [Pseudomonas corrugata]
MVELAVDLYLSYSQLCIFISSLSQPYNDWSDRNYSQGFSWRYGSVSFRALVEEGEHEIAIFIEEALPEIGSDVVRAFRVPFDVSDNNIELASISHSVPLELPIGLYILQVEFCGARDEGAPRINVRLNKGVTSFLILKADADIEQEGDFDLEALPAT